MYAVPRRQTIIMQRRDDAVCSLAQHRCDPIEFSDTEQPVKRESSTRDDPIEDSDEDSSMVFCRAVIAAKRAAAAGYKAKKTKKVKLTRTFVPMVVIAK